MVILLTVTLMVLAGYVGWESGRRWERGRQEIREEAAREAYEARGRVRLTSVRIRR